MQENIKYFYFVSLKNVKIQNLFKNNSVQMLFKYVNMRIRFKNGVNNLI